MDEHDPPPTPTATRFGLASSQPMDVPNTQRTRIRTQTTHATQTAAATAEAQADSASATEPPAAQATAPTSAFYSGFILAPDSLHSHAAFSRLAAMPLPTDSLVPAAPTAATVQPQPASSSFTARSSAAAAFSTDAAAASPLAVIPRATACRVELLEADGEEDGAESASYKAVAALPPHLQPRATSTAQRMTCCGKSIGRSPGVALRCITREEAAQLDQASASPSASPVAGAGGQSPTSPASAGFDLEFDL